MALDAGGREVGVARLQEHHAHDVVPDVALPLELLEYRNHANGNCDSGFTIHESLLNNKESIHFWTKLL